MTSNLYPPIFATLFVPLVALLALLAGACEPPAKTADVPEAQKHVAEVHRARCGNCHVRVEPGTRSHATLESAFVRHRGRVHLSEDEWSQLIEYLAQSPQQTPPG
jgi:hypothetical protein